MLKKAAKAFGLVLILSTSIGSFIYMNSSSTRLDISQGIGFEKPEFVPEDNAISTPAIAIAKKAIIIAKCFLYPAQ